MYADDSTFCVTGKSVNELDVYLNKEMNNVKDWYHNNQMASNIDKTKGMLITTYQEEPHLDKRLFFKVLFTMTTLFWKLWIL